MFVFCFLFHDLCYPEHGLYAKYWTGQEFGYIFAYECLAEISIQGALQVYIHTCIVECTKHVYTSFGGYSVVFCITEHLSVCHIGNHDGALRKIRH